MKYWGKGVPNWPAILIPILNSRKILSYPGAPGVLKWMRVENLKIEGIPGLTWHCNGLYDVNVNDGGLITEEPLEPSNESVAPLPNHNPWSGLERLGAWAKAGTKRYVNILGWKQISPVKSHSNLPRCMILGDSRWGKIDAQPLSAQEPGSCIEPKLIGSVEYIDIGPFKIYIGHRVKKHVSQGLIGYSSDIVNGCMDKSSITLYSEEGILTIKHNFYDYDVKLLYPLTFNKLARVRSTPIYASSNSIVLSTIQGSLALSSPHGIRIEAMHGKVIVEFQDKITITLGGTIQAYRTLIEQSIEWETVVSPENGYGHIRAGMASPLIVDAGPGYFDLLIQNPSEMDSIVEVKSLYPIKSIILESPLGKFELTHNRGVFRIPAPSCCICTARIELRRLLARVRLGHLGLKQE